MLVSNAREAKSQSLRASRKGRLITPLTTFGDSFARRSSLFLHWEGKAVPVSMIGKPHSVGGIFSALQPSANCDWLSIFASNGVVEPILSEIVRMDVANRVPADAGCDSAMGTFVSNRDKID